MKYRVALRKTEEGFSVSCPGLPGCLSQGATREEALANIKSAIREYLVAARILRIKSFLEDRVWPHLVEGGSRRWTKQEEERALGYGKHGEPV
jgi:predicted RNase H-like HicB family nuclease